jgi:hypothetical protein
MPNRRPLIFISYRGSDQNWATELVYARMTQAFGVEAVFKAGNSIQASERFPAILRRQAASCPVMLVLIGPGWLTAGEPGKRRLEDPDDWVRQEISISLEAGNHPVPLLIGNHDQVKIPDAQELPEVIRPLVECQAARLAPGGGLDLTLPALIDRPAALVPELGDCRAEAAQPAATIAAERSNDAREADGRKDYRQRVEATGQGIAFGVQDGAVNYYAAPGVESVGSPPNVPEHGHGA